MCKRLTQPFFSWSYQPPPDKPPFVGVFIFFLEFFVLSWLCGWLK